MERARSVLALAAVSTLLAITMTGHAAASTVGAGGVGAAPSDPPPLIPPLLGTPPADPGPEDPAADPDGPSPEGDEAEPEVPEPAPAVAAPRPGEGLPLLADGDRGRRVQELQVRLQRVRHYDAPVTGQFGRTTVGAVKRFQRELGYVPSGAVDRATHLALVEAAGPVSRTDIAAGQNRPYGSRPAASCLVGEVVCVDKTARTVRWMVDGKVKLVLDARFGRQSTPTREGVFRIHTKSRDHVSSLYGSSMPFALFFSGGQAVHYSPDFASRGYSGASHGCVNTRQYGRMGKLFDRTSVGDRLVVYRSRAVKG